MIRQTRYTVLKHTDLECLTQIEWAQLNHICAKVSHYRTQCNKAALQCVIVEQDWPIYEMVWQLIELLESLKNGQNNDQQCTRIGPDDSGLET